MEETGISVEKREEEERAQEPKENPYSESLKEAAEYYLKSVFSGEVYMTEENGIVVSAAMHIVCGSDWE